jgi:hypothetical protein
LLGAGALLVVLLACSKPSQTSDPVAPDPFAVATTVQLTPALQQLETLLPVDPPAGYTRARDSDYHAGPQDSTTSGEQGTAVEHLKVEGFQLGWSRFWERDHRHPLSVQLRQFAAANGAQQALADQVAQWETPKLHASDFDAPDIPGAIGKQLNDPSAGLTNFGVAFAAGDKQVTVVEATPDASDSSAAAIELATDAYHRINGS